MPKHIGRLEVITGSMFSGKSEELIRRIRRSKYAKQKVIVFSPSIDNRYGENGIYSHNKNNFEAYSVKDVKQMYDILSKNPDVEVIGIDEIQFLKPEVVEFCDKCVNLGVRVIVAGLDLDFRAEPFIPLPHLMAIADEVTKLSAICTVCGNPAYASQRLIDGKPAYDDDPLVSIGSTENYEARCRMHHIVKKRSEAKLSVQFNIYLLETDNKIKKFKDYFNYNLDISNSVNKLREDISNLVKTKNKVIIDIKQSISSKIEGQYSIVDLLKEFIKSSNINIVCKNEKLSIQYLKTVINLLNLNNLKVKNIFVYEEGEIYEKNYDDFSFDSISK